MGAVAQCLDNQLTTGRAHLGRIAGVHQNDRSTSFFRFADSHSNKLTPRYVHNALTHPTAFADLLRCKLFKHDHLIAVDQFATFLMGKIRCDGWQYARVSWQGLPFVWHSPASSRLSWPHLFAAGHV